MNDADFLYKEYRDLTTVANIPPAAAATLAVGLLLANKLARIDINTADLAEATRDICTYM